MVNQVYKYKIRPHHLMCILGFRGLGYNENFTINMTNIVKDLRSNPNAIIIVSPEADDICVTCPHNNKGICVKKPNSEEIVQNLDSEYIKLIQIPLRVPISINDAWKNIVSSVSLETMENICKECEWWSDGYCSEGLRELKSQFFKS